MSPSARMHICFCYTYTMKFAAPKTYVQNPLAILRKAGYSYFVDPVSKKESYILRITADYYPRFHLYLKETATEVIFDLHLDQKKASYEGSNMHGGEYEGPAVEREMQRIRDWVAAETGYQESDTVVVQEEMAPADASSTESEPRQERSLFGGIF